jgi:hypothetical protein
MNHQSFLVEAYPEHNKVRTLPAVLFPYRRCTLILFSRAVPSSQPIGKTIQGVEKASLTQTIVAFHPHPIRATVHSFYNSWYLLLSFQDHFREELFFLIPREMKMPFDWQVALQTFQPFSPMIQIAMMSVRAILEERWQSRLQMRQMISSIAFQAGDCWPLYSPSLANVVYQPLAYRKRQNMGKSESRAVLRAYEVMEA